MSYNVAEHFGSKQQFSRSSSLHRINSLTFPRVAMKKMNIVWSQLASLYFGPILTPCFKNL